MNNLIHKNVGSVDRVIRIILAVVLGALIISELITGVSAVIIGIIAAVLLITGLVGFCPVYLPFGISTEEKQEPPKRQLR